MRNSTGAGRAGAVAAIVLALAAVGYVLLKPGGTDYTVHARFQNASQLVKGNLVQVAGAPIGKVTNIEPHARRPGRHHAQDHDDATRRCARARRPIVRQASLSGVANRYVDLQLPGRHAARRRSPTAASSPRTSTTTAVDLDQLFNTFDPKTRKALQRRDPAAPPRSTAAAARSANAGFAVPQPVARRLDAGCSASSTTTRRCSQRFVVASSQLVTDARLSAATTSPASSTTSATTTGAIGRQKAALADAIAQLPPFMRRANTTFVNLRATLDDLNAAGRRVQAGRQKLRAVPRRAAPARRATRGRRCATSAHLIRRPAPNNDLIELTKSTVPLRNVAVGPVERNGKQRDGALPASTKALDAAVPRSLRAALRARPHRLVRRLQPLGRLRRARRRQPRGAPRQRLHARQRRAHADRRPRWRQAARQRLASLGQRNRCPGAVERGAAWKPDARLPLRRVAGAARAMRRVARHPRRSLVARRRSWSSLGGAGDGSRGQPTYWVELDNAFGLINGGDLKIAGVRAGKITELKLDRKTQPRAGRLRDRQDRLRSTAHRRASATSRPQSLIGEYFVDCQPGTSPAASSSRARSIPVTHTSSTVAPDLVNDILRAPYRERLSLIINELGAGVAGNGAEPQRRDPPREPGAAARPTRCWRSSPRRTTSSRDLIVNADTVVGDLAANQPRRRALGRQGAPTRPQTSAERRRDSPRASTSCRASWSSCSPTMAARRSVADDADAGAAEARRLGRRSSRPSSTTSARSPTRRARPSRRSARPRRPATRRSRPRARRRAAQHVRQGTPELGKNLAIILEHLDDRKYAVEKDPRSPGRPGLHRPRGAARVRLRPGDVDQHLRRNAHIAEGRRCAGGNCADYADVKR